MERGPFYETPYIQAEMLLACLVKYFACLLAAKAISPNNNIHFLPHPVCTKQQFKDLLTATLTD